MIFAVKNFKNLLQEANPYYQRIILCLFLLMVVIQVTFASLTVKYTPKLNIMAEVPSEISTGLASLGDKQSYFRWQALRLQNSGDEFGGVTPLRLYNYELLYHWLSFLDTLDHRSNIIPNLASYHFALTPKKADTYYIVKYLEEHSRFNPLANWWWLYHASFIAKNYYQDLEWSLRLAKKLHSLKSPDIPIWASEYAAFLYENAGRLCEAYAVMLAIMEDLKQVVELNADPQVDEHGNKYYQLPYGRKITVEEVDFMRYYLQDRLKELDGSNFDPSKCQNITTNTP